MGQDEKLESLRQYARTTVLEKEEKTEKQTEDVKQSNSSLNLFSKDVLSETKIEKQENKQELKPQSSPTPNNQKLDDLKKYIQENHMSSAQTEVIQQAELEQIEEMAPEDQVEEQIDSLYNSSLVLDATGEDIIEEEINSYSKDNSKGFQFKFKLLTGVFCVLFCILTGWIIGNAIQIAQANSQIVSQVAQGQEYEINIAKYLSKISKLDDANKEMSSPQDGSLIPIEEIIPITPQPLEDPTEYEQESNWFDKICNWFKNLFGG